MGCYASSRVKLGWRGKEGNGVSLTYTPEMKEETGRGVDIGGMGRSLG